MLSTESSVDLVGSLASLLVARLLGTVLICFKWRDVVFYELCWQNWLTCCQLSLHVNTNQFQPWHGRSCGGSEAASGSAWLIPVAPEHGLRCCFLSSLSLIKRVSDSLELQNYHIKQRDANYSTISSNCTKRNTKENQVSSLKILPTKEGGLHSSLHNYSKKA